MTHLETVKQLFVAYGKGDMETILAAMDENITWIEPGKTSSIPFSGTFKGKQEILKMFGIQSQTIDLLSFHPLYFLENSNRVAVVGNDSAKVKATQKTYYTDFTMVFHFDDNGLIDNVHVYMDTEAIAEAFALNAEALSS